MHTILFQSCDLPRNQYLFYAPFPSHQHRIMTNTKLLPRDPGCNAHCVNSLPVKKLQPIRGICLPAKDPPEPPSPTPQPLPTTALCRLTQGSLTFRPRTTHTSPETIRRTRSTKAQAPVPYLQVTKSTTRKSPKKKNRSKLPVQVRRLRRPKTMSSKRPWVTPKKTSFPLYLT